MDAKTKFDKIITGTLGLMTYVIESLKKPYEKRAGSGNGEHTVASSGASSEMVRVTDSTGEEYLCPVSATNGRDFVDEKNKQSCFDYNAISKHATE